MPITRAVVLLALLAAVSSTRAGGAQQPAEPQLPSEQQPGPTFRAGVKLVRVDVTVIGRDDDELIAGLQPDDFEVTEDGAAQKVETLQFVRLDGTRQGDTDESLAIRSPEHAAAEAARDDVRVFAVFLDDYHVDKKPQITLPLRKALRRLVEQFGPNDLVAVMDPLTPLSHLKFTRSRDDLLLRMNSFEGRRGELFPVRSVIEEGQLAHRNVWEIRAGVSLSALSALVTHLGGLREGRKSVLFVSQGPPLGRPGSQNQERLDEVLQAANRGNVTVHVLDPRPLGLSPIGGADALHRLYTETGGRAIINTNDHATPIGRIVNDASAYYLLGYAPSRDLADGKFHRIEVKVRRRGVRVLARRGYWAPTERELTAEPAPAPEPGLVEALTDLVEPKDGRQVDVWFGASRGAGGGTRLDVSWEPSERSAKTPARMIVVPVLDGEPVADRALTLAPVSGGDGERVAAFELEPGSQATLRFTAETADGDVVDQWHQSIEVPALGGSLALGTPRFLRARTAFERRAFDRGQEPPPAASRRFRQTDRVVVEVECYADQGAPAITAELLNGRGDALTTLSASPLAQGRTRLTLPLSSVAPGTYVLRLTARAGGRDASQRSAFRVVP